MKPVSFRSEKGRYPMPVKIKGIRLDRNMRSRIKSAGLTVDEWRATYKPTDLANECCIKCAKAFNGCSWSQSFTPVKDWIAEEVVTQEYSTEAMRAKKNYKIYLCPEFEQEGKRDPETLDQDKCLELLCRIAYEAKDSLVCAYRAINTLREQTSGVGYNEYLKAIANARECEMFFSDMPAAIEHCRRQARFEPSSLQECRALYKLEAK